MSRKIVIAGIATGLAGLVPLTALAQAAAQAARPASAPEQQDIARVVVTAQKRKEDIRDVPLSVSVVTGEQLQSQQINSVEDLSRNVPNISFSSQGGPGLGTVEIRGVSSQAGQATVSIYLDDVSLTTRNLYSQGTAEPRFFDLADAEILRGPQGTLYGASSLGGTVKFLSKQPDMKNYGASAQVTVSGTQHGGLNWEVQGVSNIPLVKDQFALRLGVERGHESGYIDQVDPTTLKKIAKGIDGQDYTVVKAALRANMGNGWYVTPALFAQQTNTSDIDAAYLATQGGTALPRYETSKTVREPGHDRLSVPSVTINGETGFGSFTGVLSGYTRRFNRIQDGTLINDPSYAVLNPAQYPGLVGALDALSSAVYLNNKIDQTSLELRMASKDYDPASGRHFTWIGGTYVADTVTQVYDNEPVFGVNATFAKYGFDAGDPTQLGGGFPNDFGGDSSYYSARHYHDKQSSVFGEGTWHFSPTLSATAGLRYLDASQHFEREGSFFYAGANDIVSPPVDAKWTATTPSFKLNWNVTPAETVYANVSKGFRLGGANRAVPDTPLVEQDLRKLGLPNKPPTSFAPDSLWSYELGSKSDLMNHSLALNLSAYFINWNNIQQDISLPDAGFDFETNVGRAHIYGLEAEVKARVNPSLDINAAAGLTHAVFASDQPAFGSTPSDPNDPNSPTVLNVRKGDWIQGAPRGSASLGFDYHWAVSDAVGAFVRGNGQWTGRSHGSLFRGDADYDRPSYFTADFSAGANWDRWEVTAFVKNANDNHVAIQHPDVQNVHEAYYLRPRTIGMTVNYEY
ncbi:MAG TPA: TonB-dependent receptor [Burkholderiaceae bacterium]